MTPAEIRRAVLLRLYDIYKKNPHEYVKPIELIQHIGSDEIQKTQDLEHHLEYLGESGFIDLRRLTRGVSGPIHKVKLKYKGVDIVEDPSEFNMQFPAQININITQNFTIAMQRAIEKADLPELEKKNLLSKLDDIISHPVISGIVSTQLVDLIQKYGPQILSSFPR